jgi:DNA polymerase-1
MRVLKGYVNVLLAETKDDIEQYFKKLDRKIPVVFDWETVSLDYNATPLGLSLHQDLKDPIFIPTDYFFGKGIPIKDIAEVCNKYFPLFGGEGCSLMSGRLEGLVAHNAKFDTMVFEMNGITGYNLLADTLIMVHLYDPDKEKNLEKLVRTDFSVDKQTFEEWCGKKWSRIDWAVEGEKFLESLATYSGEDAYWTTQVFYRYYKLMDMDAKRVHDRMELPLVPILKDAKIRGVKIDRSLLEEMQVQIGIEIDKLLNEIYKECGCVFNLNSPKQKQEVFFDKMRLPVIGKTRTGALSTDSKTFSAWASSGIKVGELLDEYSELNKLDSGYIKSIPELLDENDILRGDLNSLGTVTGRFASSNPNLQNQPNNDKFPIRKAFIPREGRVFLNYDYSQLELRVMAHMSKDPILIDLYLNGGDAHTDVSNRLHIKRKSAKIVNFGILYGMGPGKLADFLGINITEAKRIIDEYHRVYYGFAKWKEGVEKFAVKNGYVKTLHGRIRRLPDAKKGTTYGGDNGAYFAALRQGVNTIIQGTGAEIVKLSTIKAVEAFKKIGMDCPFILQVHDEVLFEPKISDMIEARDILIDCMENTVKLDIPLLVEGKIIKDWSEMKDDFIPSYEKRFDYSLITSLV